MNRLTYVLHWLVRRVTVYINGSHVVNKTLICLLHLPIVFAKDQYELSNGSCLELNISIYFALCNLLMEFPTVTVFIEWTYFILCKSIKIISERNPDFGWSAWELWDHRAVEFLIEFNHFAFRAVLMVSLSTDKNGAWLVVPSQPHFVIGEHFPELFGGPVVARFAQVT